MKTTESPRFVVTSDTVLDTSTGLTWQREIPGEKFMWQEARNYAAALDLDGGGWRLPTKGELLSIVDSNRRNPAIDVEAFPNTPSEWFWSASPYEDISGYAWDVDFNYGSPNPNSIDYCFWGRCVR